MTQHAWRSVNVTDEFYDLPAVHSDGQEVGQGTGTPIYLRHRKILSFTSGTDKIEVWNGSSYDEWIATKTEGRANDFWIDQEQGVLYLRYFYAFYRKKAIRLTYRYGESTVTKDIQRACALMAAIKVIQSDDRSMALAETGDATRMNYDARVTQWQKEADRIIKNRTETQLI